VSTRTIAIPFAVLLLAACNEKPQPTGATSASATSEPEKVFIYDKDLPVPADFEEEAAASIDEETYKGELDALAKEIGGS